MSAERITTHLGDEHDDALKDALRSVLVESRATVIDGSWGIGGSQQLEMLKVRLGETLVTIESETYVGLTVTGPRPSVEKLVEEVRAKLTYSYDRRRSE